MDAIARLVNESKQMPGPVYYQDKVLFIMMLQVSDATARSPSDLSKIQPVYEYREWAKSLNTSFHTDLI